jgi:hypothetical protein
MTESISSGALCVTAQIKLDEEKSKHAGFGLAFWHSLLRLVKGTMKPNTCHI